MLNLTIGLEESAQRYPNNVSFILDNHELTYQKLNELANQTANSLVKLGLQKGDKVALTCPNLLFFPVIYYGILKAGGIVVPLNVLLKQTEISYHLKDAEAKFYFCFEGSKDLPTGKYGYEAFDNTTTCKYFLEISLEQNSYKSKFEKAYSFGELISNQNT